MPYDYERDNCEEMTSGEVSVMRLSNNGLETIL